MEWDSIRTSHDVKQNYISKASSQLVSTKILSSINIRSIVIHIPLLFDFFITNQTRIMCLPLPLTFSLHPILPFLSFVYLNSYCNCSVPVFKLRI